jgi:hypothetical protein
LKKGSAELPILSLLDAVAHDACMACRPGRGVADGLTSRLPTAPAIDRRAL